MKTINAYSYMTLVFDAYDPIVPRSNPKIRAYRRISTQPTIITGTYLLLAILSDGAFSAVIVSFSLMRIFPIDSDRMERKSKKFLAFTIFDSVLMSGICQLKAVLWVFKQTE